ncbi:MAG TPA: GNAT family protein [Pseudonocardiaceae bacterium]|nr:GNAT family protein [Pseudonocardiaceae bacterium]
MISGRRVRLREFRPSDLDDSMAVVGDDRVTRWLSFDSLTVEQQEQRLNDAITRAHHSPRTEYYLAVTPQDKDRLIGFVRLGFSGVRAAKLGYAIAFDHWGHGYATDAARSMIGYGFHSLGLHRITAAIGPDNAASIALADRLGFTHEGRLRDHVHTNGMWRHSELYSLLENEWHSPGVT